jgi:RNA polymerase sigma factor (sigma-70 family)
MPRHSLESVNRIFQSVTGPSRLELPDRELLSRFAKTRDEAAFALLLERHGPLVRGVCRRVLRYDDRADDVFQAVFLILSQKAGSLRRGELLANWLFGVARRMALNAKRESARRKRRERRSAKDRPEVVPPPAWDDLMTVLEEELQRLPARYRAPLLACYYRERTQDEAARELGWNVRTLRRRLEKGREILRQRLERRGATLTAGLFAAALVPSAVDASLSPALRESTLSAVGNGTTSATVSELTRGGLRMLASSRIKTWAAVALVLTTALTAGGLGWRSFASPTAATQVEPPIATADQPEKTGERLPEGALLRLGKLRFRHGIPTSSLAMLAFSPDDKTLLSGGGDRFVRQWQLSDGVEKNAFEVNPNLPVIATLFTADGKAACQVLGDENTPRIQVFDSMAGKLLSDAGLTQSPREIDATVANIRPRLDSGGRFVLSSDGSRIAEIIDSGRLAIWETKTGKHLRTLGVLNEFRRGSPYFCSVIFSPDGNALIALELTRGSNPHFETWDLRTGEHKPVDIDEKKLRSASEADRVPWAISADGKTLAVGITELVAKELGPARQIPDVPAVERVPTGTFLRVFSLKDGGLASDIRVFEGKEVFFQQLLFAPDGQAVFFRAVRPSDGEEWGRVSLDGKKSLHIPAASAGPLGGWTERLALSHDGATVATFSGNGIIRTWAVANGSEITPTDARAPAIDAMAFHDDSVVAVGHDGKIQRWDARSGRLKSALSVPLLPGPYSRMALSPNGHWLVQSRRPIKSLGEKETSIIVNDAETGEVHSRSNAAAGWEFAFTPGDSLISVEPDKSFTEWDLKTDQKRPIGDIVPPRLVRRTTNDTVVVVDRACIGIDIKTGREVFRWDLPNDLLPEPSRPSRFPNIKIQERKKVYGTAVSPDGKFIALEVIDNNPRSQRIVLAELQNGKILQNIDLKNESANNLAFSPDGKKLVWGFVGVHLLDIASGKQTTFADGHRGYISAVAFNRDGTRLATGSADGTVLIWDTSK